MLDYIEYYVSLPWMLVVFASLQALFVKRLLFHPLSEYPGPKLWAATRLPYVVALLRGTLIDDLLKMHEKYGDVVRVAPNELSFAGEEAWRDIYTHRPGHKEARKDPIWYMAPNDIPQNIVTTTDIHVRARMRKLLSHSFTGHSLRSQEPVLEMYAEKVVNRMKSLVKEAAPRQDNRVLINFLDWCSFYSMDIIGDLALGESFGCIDGSDYHPWVKALYNFFKGMILAAAANFFPLTRYLLHHMIPASILEKQKQHTDFTNKKILQRLELNTSRPDLITPFLRKMENSPEKMSLGEIQSTFAIILVAGSETTATTLLGTFYKLATHTHVQEKLAVILKARIPTESDITVEATKDIPFLDAVINEALRLCYAVPGGFPRVVPEGGDVYCGKFVPGGTPISIRPHVTFHSPKYFSRSRDYEPERWLSLDERPQEFHNDRLAACQPFSVGPTNCIGKSLAWAEMRLLVAKVVWNFELTMARDRPWRWETLRKMMVVEKRDLWLEVRERGSQR